MTFEAIRAALLCAAADLHRPSTLMSGTLPSLPQAKRLDPPYLAQFSAAHLYKPLICSSPPPPAIPQSTPAKSTSSAVAANRYVVDNVAGNQTLRSCFATLAIRSPLNEPASQRNLAVPAAAGQQQYIWTLCDVCQWLYIPLAAVALPCTVDFCIDHNPLAKPNPSCTPQSPHLLHTSHYSRIHHNKSSIIFSPPRSSSFRIFCSPHNSFSLHSGATTVSGVVQSLWTDYLGNTPVNLKIIDAYLFYILLTGVVQFVYCCLVGTFPFNAFLSGFISAIGSFVLAGVRGNDGAEEEEADVAHVAGFPIPPPFPPFQPASVRRSILTTPRSLPTSPRSVRLRTLSSATSSCTWL